MVTNFSLLYTLIILSFLYGLSVEKKNSVNQMQTNDPLPSHISIKPLNVSPPEQCP